MIFPLLGIHVFHIFQDSLEWNVNDQNSTICIEILFVFYWILVCEISLYVIYMLVTIITFFIWAPLACQLSSIIHDCGLLMKVALGWQWINKSCLQ